MELGYWPIRGLGAAPRMMLRYADATHDDVTYDDPTTWFSTRKPTLVRANALINLPYLIDGDLVITHSNSVLRYLGKKLHIDDFANVGEEFANAQVLDEVFDLRNALMQLVYPFHRYSRTREEFEDNCAIHFASKLPGHMKKLEEMLEMRGTRFFVRDAAPCSADFHAFEMLDQHEEIAKRRGLASPLLAFPKLRAFHNEFRGLPALASYFASVSYTLPMNSPSAGAWIY